MQASPVALEALFTAKAPRRPRFALLARALATALSLAFAPTVANAQTPRDPTERMYVVGPGDTISRIAARLEVSVPALAARNYLTPPYRLSLGRRLRLPQGVSPRILRTLPTRGGLQSGGAAAVQAAMGPTPGPAHRQGFVSLVRLRDGAELATNFALANPRLRSRLERFFRYRDNTQHLVHPRMPRILMALSDHFDGRRIVVLSGFRPMLGRGGDGPRTRHSQGYALDLRVDGIAARTLHQFCQTLTDVGCGLHLPGDFVHVDVRAGSAAWVVGGRASNATTPPPPDAVETVAEVRADSAPLPGARTGDE